MKIDASCTCFPTRGDKQCTVGEAIGGGTGGMDLLLDVDVVIVVVFVEVDLHMRLVYA